MEPKTVRAMFTCTTVAKHADKSETAKFTAYRSSPDDNVDWSKYTPSGSLDMQITAEGAQGFFEPGKRYALAIVEAP